MIIDISEDGYTIEWTSMVTGEKKTATIVQLIEAFEAEPIKHGRWITEPDETVMYCDVCGWVFEYYGGLEEEWNFCPHCGARMDEVEE